MRNLDDPDPPNYINEQAETLRKKTYLRKYGDIRSRMTHLIWRHKEFKTWLDQNQNDIGNSFNNTFDLLQAYIDKKITDEQLNLEAYGLANWFHVLVDIVYRNIKAGGVLNPYTGIIKHVGFRLPKKDIENIIHIMDYFRLNP